MDSCLPAVGSVALLDLLSPFVPDDFINTRWPRVTRRPGRRPSLSAAQLWRSHLLICLWPTRAFNAVQRALSEQRLLRRFAHLPNQASAPDVRMLHEFRSRLGPGGFRAINDHLTRQLLLVAPLRYKTLALIDATDLPAHTGDKKKEVPVGARAGRLWERARSNRGRRAFSSATKSTRCAYGSAALSSWCCWPRWSPGLRQPTCRKLICLAPVWNIACGGWSFGPTS